MSAMIETRTLVKSFDDVTAVCDVDLSIEAGEIVGLVGANGAGKTTLLRMLAGILKPTSGEINIAGHLMTADAVEARAQLAFVSDTPSLFESLTVAEHLVFVAELYRVPDAAARTDALLAEFELESKRHATASSLSRGMRQKVMICCAFLHEPAVLLLDEPLTGLDPLGRRRMSDAIAARARAGTAVLVSSHQLEFVERLSQRFVVIHEGAVLAKGTLEEVAGRAKTLEEVFLAATDNSDNAADADARAPTPGP